MMNTQVMIHANKILWLLALPVFAQSPFAWKDLGGGRLELTERGKTVLVYNYSPQAKAGAPAGSSRCCYIYPLDTPSGVSVLDDAPQGEWHHHGLYWGWPVVEVGGKTYDLWQNMTLKPRSTETPATSTDASRASLAARSVWEVDGKAIVRETVLMSALRSEGAARKLVVAIGWVALGAPVTLRGAREPNKSYGGFSATFAPREGTVLRADGQTLSKDEDLIPRQWAELEGVYGGKRAVVRITPARQNAGTPYQWCLRKSGFVGASFPGKTTSVDGYTLQPGKPLTLTFTVEATDLK
jgi:hypothetical protein